MGWEVNFQGCGLMVVYASNFGLKLKCLASDERRPCQEKVGQPRESGFIFH